MLADLEKETSGPRPREKIVADVARKTPSAHSYPNMLHSTICLTELHGRSFPMDGRPVLGGARPVSNASSVFGEASGAFGEASGA
jgi:hypothetical protein